MTFEYVSAVDDHAQDAVYIGAMRHGCARGPPAGATFAVTIGEHREDHGQRERGGGGHGLVPCTGCHDRRLTVDEHDGRRPPGSKGHGVSDGDRRIGRRVATTTQRSGHRVGHRSTPGQDGHCVPVHPGAHIVAPQGPRKPNDCGLPTYSRSPTACAGHDGCARQALLDGPSDDHQLVEGQQPVRCGAVGGFEGLDIG